MKSNRKIIATILSFVFILATVCPPAAAETMVQPLLAPSIDLSAFYKPVQLEGFRIQPQNPLALNFILNQGHGNQNELQNESEKLMKIFLTALTLPQDRLWVNLSPFEQDRILDDTVSKTQIGQDFLGLDYLLKQLTASVMSPDHEVGKNFWNTLYTQAYQKLGVTDLPLESFNKIWIVPEQANVFEHNGSVYIADATLDVMLEEDYLAQSKTSRLNQSVENSKTDAERSLVSLRLDLMREQILPVIEREINEGKHFAGLRQIYKAVVLAQWYKKNVESGFLNRVFVDQLKTEGLDFENTDYIQKVYQKYVQAYHQGVHHSIKEEYNPVSGEVVARAYFSGGIGLEVSQAMMSSPVLNMKYLNDLAALVRDGDIHMATPKIGVITSGNLIQNSGVDSASLAGFLAEWFLKFREFIQQKRINRYVAELEQDVREYYEPVIEAIASEFGANVFFDHPTIYGGNQAQPFPLVNHPDRETGEKTKHRLPRVNSLTIAQSTQGQGNDSLIVGVGQRFGPEIIHVTLDVSKNLTEEDVLGVLKEKLSDQFVFRENIATAQMQFDKDIFETSSFNVRKTEQGSEINFFLFRNKGSAYQSAPEVAGTYSDVQLSLGQPSYVNRPPLSEPLNIFINGAAGAIGSIMMNRIINEASPEDGRPKHNLFVGISDRTRLVAVLKGGSHHPGALIEGDEIREFDGYVEIHSSRWEEPWTIPYYTERDPEDLESKNLEIDILFDATGQFVKEGQTEKYFKGMKVRHVVVTAPSADGKTVLVGINQNDKNVLNDKCQDAASCTTNSAASIYHALMQLVDEIDKYSLITIHAFTGKQNVLDTFKSKNGKTDPKTGYSAVQGSILTTTGAADALPGILPELEGKGFAMALRGSWPEGSLTVSKIRVKSRKKLTRKKLIKHLRELSKQEQYRGVFAIETGNFSQTQILGRPESSIIFEEGVQVYDLGDGYYRVILPTWYDNAYGYSGRPLDMIHFLGEKILLEKAEEAKDWLTRVLREANVSVDVAKQIADEWGVDSVKVKQGLQTGLPFEVTVDGKLMEVSVAAQTNRRGFKVIAVGLNEQELRQISFKSEKDDGQHFRVVSSEAVDPFQRDSAELVHRKGGIDFESSFGNIAMDQAKVNVADFKQVSSENVLGLYIKSFELEKIYNPQDIDLVNLDENPFQDSSSDAEKWDREFELLSRWED